MNSKQLFLKTIEDLENKTNSNDWYDMLLISNLIYKLLFDEHPLADEVNTSKLKIVFTINDRKLPLDSSLIFWSIEDGFDPETSPPHLSKPITVGRNDLYACNIMVISGKEISVKDLIRFLRNKQGGVHIDNISMSEKERILKELQSYLSIGGVSVGLRLMRAISRTVVKGLMPLKAKLN